MRQPNQKKKELKVVRSSAVPVTKAMLMKVRDEFKADFKAVRGELKSHRGVLGGQMKSLDGQMQGLRGEMQGLKGQMQGLEGQMQSLEGRLVSEIHRVALLVEDQNACNVFVLDGLNSLFGRQERLESRVEELEKFRVVEK